MHIAMIDSTPTLHSKLECTAIGFNLTIVRGVLQFIVQDSFWMMCGPESGAEVLLLFIFLLT